MTLLPKPFKRAEKRCKPISRRARVNRKRKTSRGAQGRLADKLFSLIVRHPGVCSYHGAFSAPEPYGSGCQGGLQCAHLCSRRYRSTRWDFDNAVPLCAGAHMLMTHDPLRWDEWVEMRMGAEPWKALKKRALSKWDGDLESVLVRLAARAVALGIKSEKENR